MHGFFSGEDAVFRFGPELGELLTRPMSDGLVTYRVDRRASIKDVIESLGVPHTEIHFLASGGEERGFGWLLPAGVEVEVRGAVPGRVVDPTRPTGLRPDPLPWLRFAVDENVGRLAGLLRMAGFDTAYDRTLDDARLAELAVSQGRVLLSRDRALLKRSAVAHGRLVRAFDPWDQLAEVARVYGLGHRLALFTRCIRCNGELSEVDKAVVLDQLEPKTRRYYERFSRCRDCGRVYWKGSHYGHMLRALADAGLGREEAEHGLELP